MTSSPIGEGFVPFPPDRASSYRAAGYWSGRTVDSMLTDAAHHRPTHIAVVDADGPGRLSFAQLDERADHAAAGLAELGIDIGDRCCCSCRTPANSRWRYSRSCAPARSR